MSLELKPAMPTQAGKYEQFEHPGAAPRGPAWLRILVLGFLTHFIFLMVYRIVLVKFPVNLILPGILVWALAGLAAGVLAASRGAEHFKRWAPLVGAAGAVFLFAVIANQNVTTHYLLGEVYYPYPLPPRSYLHIGGIIGAVALCPALFVAAGWLLGLELPRMGGGRAGYGLFALGMAAAAPAGYFSIMWFGPYAPLITAAGVLMLFLPKKTWAFLSAGACAVALVMSLTNRNQAFYVWRIDEYKHLSSHWTPYYRLDFIEFKEGHCVGGVYNTIMIWYTCDSVSALPAEMRRVIGNVSRDKKRVLLAGRTDGLYASMLYADDPDIESFTSVAYDPVAAKMMTGPYAKYNGGVLSRPETRVISGDIRQTLDRLARNGEKFDLIFHNGIGIRLFNQPRGVTFQEDYLTARENYDVIFNKLLTRNGVYVIDWGSSMEDEVYPMMANIPEGVYVRAFHCWIGEFPLSGLPLFYVIASRDRAQVNRIADDLLLLPTIGEIHLNPDKIRNAKFTEDKPYHLKPLAPGLLVLMAPFFIMLAVYTTHAGLRVPWRFPVSTMYLCFYAVWFVLTYLLVFRSSLFYGSGTSHQTKVWGALLLISVFAFLLQYAFRAGWSWGRGLRAGRGKLATFAWKAGLAWGMLETFVYSRMTRLMDGGPGPGVMWMGIALCAGLAAALLLWPGRSGPGRVARGAGAVLILVLLPWGAAGLHAAAPVAVVAAILAAAGALPLAALLARTPRSARARMLGLFLLGSAAGLYLVQWLAGATAAFYFVPLLPLLTGHRIAAYLIGAFYLTLAFSKAPENMTENSSSENT